MHPSRNILLAAVLVALVVPALSYAQDKDKLKLSTVVVDAGHGGHDPGCISKDRKTQEKNLTLDISRRLAEMIRSFYPDVKVICTRSTDKFVSLDERAAIANRNHANLFISIHINAVANTAPQGYSCHIFGNSSKRDLFSSNMDVCLRENSVIRLEDDYTTKYQGFDPDDPESFIFFNLMSNAYYEQSLLFAAEVNEQMGKGPFTTERGIFQDPLLVLWKTSMPAVLIEAGFISNPSDLTVLRSEDGPEKIAQTVFYAFRSFKQKYDSSLGSDIDSRAPVQSEPQVDSTAAGKSFGIQIAASSRYLEPDDPFFKKQHAVAIKAGSLYKYIVAVAGNLSVVKEQLSEIKKIFPESFIVEIDGQIVRKL